ncbi:MAG: hypothetical protein ACYTGL_28405 [Planctomycetota bacterium]|jgi:hypothetical protein
MKTKWKAITGSRIQKLPTQMDETVESGRLVAAYARKENGKVDYDITVFRRAGTSQRSGHRFEAADVEHLARLAQYLAFEVSEDQAMDQELRDDLGCLAASLESVFNTDRIRNALYCRRDGNAWNLLAQLLRDDLQLLEMSFRETPYSSHPYRRLVALDLWMRGIGPRDGFNLPELAPTGIEDYFGGCPICGKNEGYLNVWREHWFFCQDHKVRWIAGENLFSSWRYEDSGDWNQTLQEIGGFIEVAPMCNPNHRSKSA